MKQSYDTIPGTTITYRIAVLACIVVAELLMLAVFLFWPIPEQGEDDFSYQPRDAEVFIEEVQITTQEGSPPPPPKPLVPVPVPDDEIVEEEFLTLEDINPSEFAEPLSETTHGTLGQGDEVAANPDTPPSIIRIVEATVPSAAKRAGIKAEIWVSFLVNTEGMVEEATISKIHIYNEEGSSYEVVDRIGYGLSEATLEAALQWKFRPARNNGQPVPAYTQHIFSFGF